MFDKVSAVADFSSLSPSDQQAKLLNMLDEIKDVDEGYKAMLDHITLLGDEYDTRVMQDYFAIVANKMAGAESSKHEAYAAQMTAQAAEAKARAASKEQEAAEADELLEGL